MKISLHIFTNCHKSAPSTKLVRRSYNSFIETFGYDFLDTNNVKIWLDPNPRKNIYDKYKRNLSKNFRNIEKTASLSDGYIKAIKSSNADYLFMLEGDWIFNSELIRSSLDEICLMMFSENIYHLRFNKRKNAVAGWDKTLTEHHNEIFPYCITNILSNNPHIIDRKKYLEFTKKGYIRAEKGSKGIEEIISKIPELTGAIYGGIGYTATVEHIDGRHGR